MPKKDGRYMFTRGLLGVILGTLSDAILAPWILTGLGKLKTIIKEELGYQEV